MNETVQTLPREFGGYTLLEELGRGGYGIIYKARQHDLERLCAVKMLLEERFQLPTGRSELLSEARAAARLDHPNIVGIFEVAEAEGRPFFSMEYVEGENLSTFTRRRILSAPQIARYAQKIAETIQYAHSQGVLHCDLKPANVLIDLRDEPRLTDFGLARRLTHDGAPSTPSGSDGAGSPNFMAPEQASMRFGDVGPHTDVFGLGATLYYLLTDRPPFRGETAQDTIRAVLELDPVRPRSLRPGVPQDLETICLKCLEKRRSRRYGSAQEVADELGRFLRDEPILARPASLVERGWRRARRHPWLTGFATATAALVLLVAVGSSVAAFRINEARRAADSERIRAVSAEEAARQNLYAADMSMAFEALAAGRDGQVREILRFHEPKAGQTDLRGWEWRFLQDQARPDFVREWKGHSGEVYQIRFLAGGRQWISSDNAGELHLWDSRSNAPIQSLAARPGASPLFALNPTGTQLATTERAPSATNTIVQILEVPSFRTVATHTVPGVLRVLEFAPDGGTLWLVGNQRWAGLSLPAGQLKHDRTVDFRMDRPVFALSPDGTRLLTSDRDGTLVLFSTQTGLELARHAGHDFRALWTASPHSMMFSPDGTSVATGAGDGTVRIWDGHTLEPRSVLRGHQDIVLSFGFSPDGRRLASSGRDSDLLLWDVPRGALEARLKGNPALSRQIQFLPDGSSLLTAGNDQTVRQWSLSPTSRGPEHHRLAEPENVVSLLSDERAYIIAHPNRQEFRVHRLTDHSLAAGFNTDPEALSGGATLLPGGGVMGAELFPDGRLRWGPLPDGPFRELRESDWITTPGSATASIDFSPSGQLMAVGDHINGLRIWRLADSRRLHHLKQWRVTTFRFSPDGRHLLGASVVGQVFLLDLESGAVHELASDTQQIPAVNFTPDGRWAASAGIDGAVRIFDVETKRQVHRLESRAGILLSVALNADGTRVFGGSLDGFISVWDLKTGRELGVLGGARFGSTNSVVSLAVTPEGDLISTASDGIRRWRVPPPGDQPVSQSKPMSLQ